MPEIHVAPETCSCRYPDLWGSHRFCTLCGKRGKGLDALPSRPMTDTDLAVIEARLKRYNFVDPHGPVAAAFRLLGEVRRLRAEAGTHA